MSPWSGARSLQDITNGERTTIVNALNLPLWENQSDINGIKFPTLVTDSSYSVYATPPVPAGFHGATCGTISMVINRTGTASSMKFPMITNTSTDDYYYFFGATMYTGLMRTARVDAIASTLADSYMREWHHLCVTTDGTNWIMYENGIAIKTVAAESTVNAPIIGIAGNASIGYFTGGYYSIRIWSGRALTQSEVMHDWIEAKKRYPNLLNRYRPGFIASPPAAPAGLAANPLYGGGAAANPLWGYVA